MNKNVLKETKNKIHVYVQYIDSQLEDAPIFKFCGLSSSLILDLDRRSTCLVENTFSKINFLFYFSNV